MDDYRETDSNRCAHEPERSADPDLSDPAENRNIDGDGMHSVGRSVGELMDMVPALRPAFLGTHQTISGVFHLIGGLFAGD